MSAQLLQTTPPESLTSPPTSPPTPPPVSEEKTSVCVSQVLAAVRQHRDGRKRPTEEFWLRFSLNVHQHEELKRRLRKADLWDHYKH